MQEHALNDDRNVDYKKMYLRLMRAVEDAIHTLIEAERECEELYILAGDDPIKSLPDEGPGAV